MKHPAASPVRLAPVLRAIPFVGAQAGTTAPMPTPSQREQLARIGVRLRLPPRMMIYREQSPARWVFVVIEGVVKTFRDLPSGKRPVTAFLAPGDLFGLAEQGLYCNCAQAITRVALYRLPLEDLVVLLKHDADLQFQFLAKVTHELREAQRRSIVINRRDAVGRLAMFITAAQEQAPDSRGLRVSLPMTRSDIASFLGLSLETVSRAAAALERRGIVRFDSRHSVRILDPKRLGKLTADT